MPIWFVVIHLLLSLAIGLCVATRVPKTHDFAVAGAFGSWRFAQ